MDLTRGLVHLEVRRRGPVLPTAHGFGDRGSAQWTAPLPVEPQAGAFVAEDVLANQHHRFSKFCLADRADLPSFAALLAGRTHAAAL